MKHKIVRIQFDTKSGEPLYLQLFQYLKECILNEEIIYGSKLPAIRSLAKELGVNNITIINAYKQLELAGYVTSKQGSGYYVSKRLRTSLSPSYTPKSKEQNVINFGSVSPHPEIFPVETFKQYITEAIDRDKGFAFGYQEINGYLPLREVLTTFLSQTYNITTCKKQIQIVSGGQQGLDIIAKSLLYSGDSVITENPTYNGAVEVFKSRGCRTVPVNIHSQGINLIELEKKVRICKPKLVYVMPNYQNPTTFCYSKSTLLELLKLAETYQFYILEEDSMCELSYSHKTNLTLKSFDTNDRVIYLKSFSKLLMPGLRMGFIIMPSTLCESFTRTKQATDISSSGLIQRALDLYLRNNKWYEHILYMREIYKNKYEYMLEKLEMLEKYNIQFFIPEGGLCFWLTLPPHLSAEKLSAECLKNGLIILPSPMYFSHLDSFKDRHIRLSFASCSFNEIEKGITILRHCLNTLMN
ncbi:GntR family transcriptional regulator [Sporanaerobium hydrogeniformans]|uniref:GntR family transcriptional regulator n=1 Tax=Sporanaerobium hydrogeniformans TaxID=3072179 RepID=A0AC61D8Y6_9FIRM|nr:PLP-dependent aminotransferase family protein [Sporanaerobium hydrogeniformans]PHV69203.1 GntR family transcriptional regulator [Sporanaerobium hydrogeniformans]